MWQVWHAYACVASEARAASVASVHAWQLWRVRHAWRAGHLNDRLAVGREQVDQLALGEPAEIGAREPRGLDGERLKVKGPALDRVDGHRGQLRRDGLLDAVRIGAGCGRAPWPRVGREPRLQRWARQPPVNAAAQQVARLEPERAPVAPGVQAG